MDYNTKMVIYKATSPSGKVYIGMTNNLKYRKKKHLIDSKKRAGKFHHAINKYGFDSFKWEILHACKERSEACKLEQAEIKNYDSFQNGYNMTIGGDGVSGLPVNPETRRKISLHSSKTKCKPINVFKKVDLEYIGTWQMRTDFEIEYNLPKSSIAKHLWQKDHGVLSNKTAFGFFITTDSIDSVEKNKQSILNFINTDGNKGNPKWNKGLHFTKEFLAEKRILRNQKKYNQQKIAV